jgi:hypothetical protein
VTWVPLPRSAPFSQPPRTDFRLRCGDYRLFFDPHGKDTIRITRVLNRRKAYRFQNSPFASTTVHFTHKHT